MRKLRTQSAQPRSTSTAPSYPRVVGLGLALSLAACGGQSAGDAPEGQGGEGGTGSQVGGGMPPSYDAGAEAEAEPPPAGMIAAPYDGGDEAEADVEPPPDGDIAPPFDAGEDAWVEPDAEMGGGAPEPFDAGEDAELGGAAPPPFDAGGSW